MKAFSPAGQARYNNYVTSPKASPVCRRVGGTTALLIALLPGCDSPSPAGPPIEEVWTVRVDPVSFTMTAGQARVIAASALSQAGIVLSGRSIQWTSSDTSVARIDNTGRVIALRGGNVDLTARVEARAGTSRLTVVELAPAVEVTAITVRPSFVVTYVSASSALRVTLRDAQGQLVTDRPIAWTTADPTIATVDGNGVVTGNGVGETMVYARVDTVSASVAVAFRTGWSYHLVYDRAEPSFVRMDLRTGLTSRSLQHGPDFRSTSPSADPDRTGVVYALTDLLGNSQLAIQSIDAATYRFLTAGDQPAWSPTDDRIVFRRVSTGRSDIWVVPADGSSEPVNLTADLMASVRSERPAWSPDGTKLVFAAGDETATHLWTMNADGTQKRQITGGARFDTEPSWFGQSIVFARKNAVGAGEIWSLDLASNAQRQRTHLIWSATPAWAPDGRWIAFTAGSGVAHEADVFVMRPDGTDVRPVSLRSDGSDGGGLNPSFVLHR